MKRLGLLALLLANSSIHALNPVQGWYGGILLGLNYTPSTNFIFPSTFVPPTDLPSNIILPTDSYGELTYGHMGQLAGQLGYRCGKYRIEGQLGYNNSPYKTLKVNDFTLIGSTTTTNLNYTSKGATNTASFMVNGYFDLLPTDPDSSFAPLIGIGLGYASTQNQIELTYWTSSGVEVSPNINIKETTNSPAGQVMIGGSVFLDDFTAFSLDLRYFTTQKKSETTDARVQVASINLTFNGAFDAG